MTNKNLPEILRDFRKDNNMSMFDLAEKMREKIDK